MKSIIEDINSAKHIEIEVKEELIALGSALYTYILTQHKKVSFVCKTKEINTQFAFLPWFEKIKVTNSSSADLNLKLNSTSLEVFETLKSANTKINPKMATALYGALILESENFTNFKTDGTFFATASELIDLGADYKLCIKNLLKRTTLSEFRLKSLMFQKMKLIDSAKSAQFEISQDDLKSCGATLEDAFMVIREAFNLEYINSVVLLDTQNQNKIIKTLEKEI